MRYFRSIRLLRVIVSLTLLCVGSVTLVPTVRADAAVSGYAEWLRLHLPGGLQPQVQEALDRASETGARSFDDFLQAFLDEVISGVSENPLSDVTDGIDVEDDAFIQDLRRQFNGRIGTAVLNRHFEALASARTDCLKKRPVREGTMLSGSPPDFPDGVSERQLTGFAPVVSCRFLRSSAQPLGP